MSTQLKHKGKFAKEHIVAAKAKRVAALLAASRKRAQEAKEFLVAEQSGSIQERYQFEGRRIVDMQEFVKNLECYLCKTRLDIINTVKEKLIGLHSILSIRCLHCSTVSSVPTGKTHLTKNMKTQYDTNTEIVLGMLYHTINYQYSSFFIIELIYYF